MTRTTWIAPVLVCIVLAAPARGQDGDEVRSIGDGYKGAQDWVGGIRAFEEMLREKPANWGADSDAEAAALWYLAEFHKGAKEVDKADRRYEQAMHMRERRKEDRIAAIIAMDLGLHRFANGRYEKAVEAYDRALAWQIKLHGKNSLEAAQQHHNLGYAAKAGENYARAGTALKKAYEIRTSQLAPNDLRIVDTLEALADLSSRRGEVARSNEWYLKARDILDANPTIAPPSRLANVNKELAENYEHLHEFDKTDACLRRAFELYDATDPASAANVMNYQCWYAIERGQYSRADVALDSYRKYCEQRLPANHMQQAWVESAFGHRHMVANRYADAEWAFRSGIDKLIASNSGRTVDNAYTLRISLAKSLVKQGRFPDAKRELRTALAECERMNGPKGLATGGNLWSIALVLIDAKEYDEARRQLERAATIWDNPECKCHL
ncbi:MAG: tetratricopeptide repeat protein [Gemmataceae bacterium]|nr:tetratricopeptide repeat protein [Gemmataceae bacterium]